MSQYTRYPVENGGGGSGITQLTGDVTAGPGSGAEAATVQSVGGASATDVAQSVTDTQAATSSNTPNTIVKRNGSGNFTAGTITASLTGNVSGNLTGNVTGNVSGTSANVTGIVAIVNGGTGSSTKNFVDLSTAQTVAGVKTFSSQVNTDSGLQRSTSGTLSIGTDSNSPTINIGNSGATINIQGTTLYENVTELQVTDPLITLNKGGGAGSAANSGIQLEENALITGYAETSADRNSWQLKAPNTAGIATITAGVGGITLDQSSHSAVTLAAFGSTPNANAASLSGQVLNLQPADASNPGGVSTTTQSFAGNKTLTGNLIVQGSTTLATSLTGPLKATSGVVSASSINLTSEVTGTLPIANGGTGQTSSSAAFNALSPVTSTGDLIVGNGTNSSTRLAIGSTGQFLKVVGGTATWANLSASFTAPTTQVFTSGSGTYTRPTNPTPLYIKVIAIGGGGGGGGTGTSGPSAGGSGGDTTFSTYTAAGGGGGGFGDGATGGTGGAPNANSGSPTISILGGYGEYTQFSTATTTTPNGGTGGSGYFGGAGVSSPGAAGFSGATNSGAGGGGAGGNTALFFSGAGGASGSYIEQIIGSPSTTYSYSVGASGTLGASGISGFNGGAGGSGLIIIEEYYQ